MSAYCLFLHHNYTVSPHMHFCIHRAGGRPILQYVGRWRFGGGWSVHNTLLSIVQYTISFNTYEVPAVPPIKPLKTSSSHTCYNSEDNHTGYSPSIYDVIMEKMADVLSYHYYNYRSDVSRRHDSADMI